MSKEKVFIVVTHKHSLQAGTESQWEVTEVVEFVNQLRKRHVELSSAIGNYIDRKMISGRRIGMSDYDQFEDYVRTKYEKQMTELDSMYRMDQVAVEATAEQAVDSVVDTFGNTRDRTVFDL